jgi:protein-disulfide isomerase
MVFSDYQCPYCVRSEPVLAEVLSRYPDSVRLIHRHFPHDSILPFARPAAEAAMCAEEQGKFWEFHDGIFALNGRLDASSFLAIGADLDLDPGALGECLEERRYEKFVQEDLLAGQAAGVTGTPAFFVNGIAMKGARDADDLSRVVDSELARIQAN